MKLRWITGDEPSWQQQENASTIYITFDDGTQIIIEEHAQLFQIDIKPARDSVNMAQVSMRVR